jgi:hypothetical protein
MYSLRNFVPGGHGDLLMQPAVPIPYVAGASSDFVSLKSTFMIFCKREITTNIIVSIDKLQRSSNQQAAGKRKSFLIFENFFSPLQTLAGVEVLWC